MKRVLLSWCAAAVVLTCLFVACPPAEAGFLDDVKTIGKSVAKDVEKTGQQLGMTNEPKLPGGVSSRLKKASTELTRAMPPCYAGRDWLPLEVAPAPGQMKAYSDPALEYGKSTAAMRQGPMELSHQLSTLGPGKHTMDFLIRNYGKTYAQGSFTIEGQDFTSYAELNKTAAKAVDASAILPRAKQQDGWMAAKMKLLLNKAGWPEIYRLNILDKDWWINRVSGGDSPISSRHMAAAVMAHDGQVYSYKICTFQQPRLITGVGWK